VRTGISNLNGDTDFSEPAKALTTDDLYAIHATLDLTTFTDARDWCASLIAFFGLLRIKEYTCSGLLVRHVTQEKWGINLTIPFSKTSLIPTTVSLARRDDDVLCPLAAYRAYIKLVPDAYRRPDRPLFLEHAHSDAPLTDTTFIRHVRRWVTKVLRQDPTDYSGHSFRRGGTTALLLAGVPEATIAAHGRWKSLAYRGYFDVQHSVRLRLAATAQLSLHSRRRTGSTPL
jgi:integrase